MYYFHLFATHFREEWKTKREFRWHGIDIEFNYHNYSIVSLILLYDCAIEIIINSTSSYSMSYL